MRSSVLWSHTQNGYGSYKEYITRWSLNNLPRCRSHQNVILFVPVIHMIDWVDTDEIVPSELLPRDPGSHSLSWIWDRLLGTWPVNQEKRDTYQKFHLSPSRKSLPIPLRNDIYERNNKTPGRSTQNRSGSQLSKT